MNPTVVGQVLPLHKRFPTNFTKEASIGVYLPVSGQCSAICKALPTIRASVRLFAGVHANMDAKLGFLLKLRATSVAAVRPLARMDALVVLQVNPLNELLIAVLTSEDLSVH